MNNVCQIIGCPNLEPQIGVILKHVDIFPVTDFET